MTNLLGTRYIDASSVAASLCDASPLLIFASMCCYIEHQAGRLVTGLFPAANDSARCCSSARAELRRCAGCGSRCARLHSALRLRTCRSPDQVAPDFATAGALRTRWRPAKARPAEGRRTVKWCIIARWTPRRMPRYSSSLAPWSSHPGTKLLGGRVLCPRSRVCTGGGSEDFPRRLIPQRARGPEGLTLLYAGISPKEPPQNGRAPSRQNLRTRVRTHYAGNAEGATLRKTLGCLLADEFAGIELRRVGSGKRMTFVEGEGLLSAWMATHALVSWVTHAHPWELEARLIETLDLPLNLEGNAHNRFRSENSQDGPERCGCASKVTPHRSEPRRRRPLSLLAWRLRVPAAIPRPAGLKDWNLRIGRASSARTVSRMPKRSVAVVALVLGLSGCGGAALVMPDADVAGRGSDAGGDQNGSDSGSGDGSDSGAGGVADGEPDAGVDAGLDGGSVPAPFRVATFNLQIFGPTEELPTPRCCR